MIDHISQQVSTILLSIRAIVLSPHKPIRFTSGILSPIYVDNRLLCSHVAEREKVVDFFVQKLGEKLVQVDVVAGTATAGIPHAAWIAQRMCLPMVYVRAKPKEHGMGKQIEGGILSPSQHVVLIEDLISTGKSSLATLDALRSEGGAICNDIFAIYTHKMKISEEVFFQAGVTLTTLTNFTDLIDVAVALDYLSHADRDLVLEWSDNPQAWTKKMESVATE